MHRLMIAHDEEFGVLVSLQQLQLPIKDGKITTKPVWKHCADFSTDVETVQAVYQLGGLSGSSFPFNAQLAYDCL